MISSIVLVANFSSNIFSPCQQRHKQVISFNFNLISHLWVKLANCVSSDSFCHALHNFYFSSADVDLLNLSQKNRNNIFLKINF